MKYAYFSLVGILILATLYILSGIFFLKNAVYQTSHPKAQFQIIDNGTNELTIVDFTNYRCGYCKKMYLTLKEALSLQKNIRYIPRPIPLKIDNEKQNKQQPIELEKLALAAGLQGKFQEIHDSFMEHPAGIIPESTIQETAMLYGIDYEKMVQDAQSKKIQNILDENITDMLNMNIHSIPSYIINKNIYVVYDTLPDLAKILTTIENEKK